MPDGAHALEDLGLGVGDGLDGIEELDMGRLDGGDDRHIGTDHAGEGTQLAGMIHAELEDAQRGPRAAGGRGSAARPNDC